MNLDETILLLTRPQLPSERFRAQVEAALGRFERVVIAPLMEIVHLAPADLPGVNDDLAFTSENGVAALLSLQPSGGRRAWCVGPRTARRAREAGFDVIQAQGTEEKMTELLMSSASRRPICYLAGRHRRGNLARNLREAGIVARTVEIYDQRQLPLSNEARSVLATRKSVMAPLFSPRSAQLLSDAAKDRHATVTAVAISKNAATSWVPRSSERVLIAGRPDAQGMISAMGSLFDADPSA